MKELFDFISRRIPLNDEIRDFTQSISKVKEIKKGDKLITEGQYVNKTYFVVDGCLRSYVYDIKGKEHTLQFALKDHWISDYMAIFSKQKSTLIIESISDSIVIEASITEGIDNICEKYPALEFLHRKSLEHYIVNLQKRILDQLQLPALDRYKLLLKKYKHIEEFALNYHIASYLGITQQSLSRIRAETRSL
ncbi:MAG: Crp/Fnr family transcriptional regulator [Bacteroidota bacterium]|nr:Crp/Fnr family transcriptional regulator [Bacteroidota bacterium]